MKKQKQKTSQQTKVLDWMASQVKFAQLWHLTPFISPNYNPKTVNELKAIADMQRKGNNKTHLPRSKNYLSTNVRNIIFILGTFLPISHATYP